MNIIIIDCNYLKFIANIFTLFVYSSSTEFLPPRIFKLLNRLIIRFTVCQKFYINVIIANLVVFSLSMPGGIVKCLVTPPNCYCP